MLHAEDVTVVIPPGALARNTVLTLDVEPSGLVHVSPSVTLDSPGVVGFSLTRWAPGFADSGAPDTADIYGRAGWSDVRAYVNVLRLSSFSLPDAATVALPLGFDASPWSVRDASAPWEPDHTLLPPVDRSDIDSECLVSASDLVENRHDRPYRLLRLGRQVDEATTMSWEAYVALATARALMAEVMPGYDIWLTGAWDSSGRIHRSKSTHYFGAALDMGIARWTGRSWAKMKPPDPRVLGRIPDILRVSGFSWVLFENRRHVHASISSPSVAHCVPEIAGAISPEAPAFADDLADPCIDDDQTPMLLDCALQLP